MKHRLLIIGFLVLTIFLVVKSSSNRVRAQSSPTLRGAAGDLWADLVLGKPDFGEGVPGEVVGFKVMNPGGVAVDRSVQPNVVYAYDGANSRVLGFRSLGTCSFDQFLNCTTNSDCQDVNNPYASCKITSGKSADFVLGQPDLNHAACNADSNYQNYPERAPASAASLCTIPAYQVSTTEGGSFANMAVDHLGNLYVPDFDNNRILKYIKPYQTDTIADSVWGQADFSGNGCNRGRLWENLTTPQNNTLCLRSFYNQGFGGGVEIDQAGNLWVADNQNNRVLRFPFNPLTSEPDKTADLVLGQPNFTSNRRTNNTANCDPATEFCDYDPTSPRDNFWAPVAVRIDTVNGNLYMADSLNHRILVFSPPFASGMAAQATFATRPSTRSKTDFFPNHYPKSPLGMEFDLNREGIWVNDTGNEQVVLFDFAGNPKKVLAKDTFQPNGKCGSVTAGQTCLNPQIDPATGTSTCWNYMCSTVGSLGIDNDNNLFVTSGSSMQDMRRFSYPIPTINPGKVVSADARFFYPPGGRNYSLGNKGMTVPVGIAKTDSQFIVADGGNDRGRLMYWNTANGLADLLNGKEADGVAAVPGFDSQNPAAFIGRMAVYQDKLWVIKGSRLSFYQLPLTFGAVPARDIFWEGQNIPVLGGGTLSWVYGDDFMGLAFDSAGNLWLTQSREHPPYLKHRAFRVRNPATNPVIDVILGQTDLSEMMCNQYRDPEYPSSYDYGEAYRHKAPNTVCFPGAIKVDRYDNVWLSDFSLEFKGNWRLLKFEKNLFDNINTSALFAPAANFIIDDLMVLDMAFDSQDRMMVGINGYSKMFPAYFDKNPDGSYQGVPTAYFKDLYSMPDQMVTDSLDNLYITDLNRGRALIYLNPFNNPPLPTVSVTPTPTVTLTPTPLTGFGHAVSFSDSNPGYLDIPYRSNLSLAGNFTFETWIKFDKIDKSYVLLSQKIITSQSGGYAFAVDDNRLGVDLYTSDGQEYWVMTNTAVIPNRWYHFAVVKLGQELKLYVDGNLDRSVSLHIPDLKIFASDLTVGSMLFDTQQYYTLNGVLDELRLSNIARYTGNFAVPAIPHVNDDSTLLLYNFDHASGSTVVRDSSLFDNTGTVVGSAGFIPNDRLNTPPTVSPSVAVTNTPTPTVTVIPTSTPTITPTPTFLPPPTVTPVVSTLTVNYLYAGVWTDIGSQTLTISLYEGGQLVASENVVADNIGGGVYQAKLLPAPSGFFQVKIKTDRHLQRMATGVLIIEGNTDLDFASPLIPGDIASSIDGNDNLINLLDYNRLLSDYGKAGVASDLDYSGLVDIADYNILLQNFGILGE